MSIAVGFSEVAAQELLHGRVVDGSGTPVAGAVVEALGTSWQAFSGSQGYFGIELPSGEWRLRVSRIGYRTAELTLDSTDGARDSLLVVTLVADPIALRGLTVEGARTPPMGRSVTTETVRQVPPLGEPDVFRAIVLLPAVSQPNDLKGRIHLAGGASDETGVRLDGHPLQDPFHLLGLFGAFNVAALDRADIRIHHLPPSIGGRLSGSIDLETRQSPRGSWRDGEAVLGLLTSGATVLQSGLPGGIDVLASGRVTYLDKIVPLIVDDVPRLGFHDAMLRLGRSWNDGWRLELLGFLTRDEFSDNDSIGDPGYEPLAWGEALGGVRLIRDDQRWDVALRGSFDRAYAHMDEGGSRQTSNSLHSRRDWLSVAGSAGLTTSGWHLHGGVSFDRRAHEHEWRARGLVDEIFSPHTPESYSGAERSSVFAMYGEATVERWRPWSMSAGVRVSWLNGEAYPGPRVVLGYRIDDRLRLGVAFDRRFQFDAQIEEPIEGSITPPLFLLDSPRTADVIAASGEWTADLAFADAARFRAYAFYKRYPDRTRTGDETFDASQDARGTSFPRFDRLRGYSLGSGVEAILRLHGAVIQGSYAYQRVREEFGDADFPTAWDAPHNVTLFASVPMGENWSFSGVYQGHSGRAATPVIARIFEPHLDFESGGLAPRYLLGERNSIRVPGYHRADLGMRYAWDAIGAKWTLAFQVLNVLFRENAIGYDWRAYFSDLRRLETDGPRAGRSGLPLLPSVGLEVRW